MNYAYSHSLPSLKFHCPIRHCCLLKNLTPRRVSLATISLPYIFSHKKYELHVYEYITWLNFIKTHLQLKAELINTKIYELINRHINCINRREASQLTHFGF